VLTFVRRLCSAHDVVSATLLSVYWSLHQKNNQKEGWELLVPPGGGLPHTYSPAFSAGTKSTSVAASVTW
jgi:hypothetical protein